jgi:hypothetical protein
VSALQDRCKVSRIGPIDGDHERALKQLKQVVPAHHQALGELEGPSYGSSRHLLLWREYYSAPARR